MRLLAPLLLMSLMLAACSDDSGSTQSAPPAEMVGAWQEAVPQVVSSGPQDVCTGLSVGAGTVSSFLFKVDSFGNVYDGKNMSDANNPYRMIGTMDKSGNIIPNAAGRDEFLGEFGSISGVTLNPLVSSKLDLSELALKGPIMELNIELQIISNGQTSTYPLPAREYYKLTETTEQLTITKAKQCLAKTKGF